MKRILITYATAGIGHKKAAIAVKKAFEELAPRDVEVTMIDSLDYTNAFFKSSYLAVYLFMISKIPSVWGFSYYLTDNIVVNFFVAKIRRLNNWLNSFRLVKYLIKNRFDAVITTHFFANEVISDLKKKGLLNTRLITVVTDYRLHAWWISGCVDAYVVGGEDAKRDLVERGVPADKVKTLGIPAEPVFSKEMDRKNILEKENLKDGLFTILVIGGGFGVGPIEDIVKVIRDISKDTQIIAICGHNKALADRLSDIKEALGGEIKILGFADNVYEYMAISDLLISKSGGITVTEAMARGLPMIIIAPITGQETSNAGFLVNNNAAIRADKTDDLKDVLGKILAHPEKIKRLKESIAAIRKPAACYDIAKFAIEAVRNSP